MLKFLPEKTELKRLNALFFLMASLIIFILISFIIQNFENKKKIVKVDNYILLNEHSSSTPQFVLFSFDGSKSIEMWKETIDFGDYMYSKKIPIHFTYFVNAAYLLAPENASNYTSPEEKVGVSAIGFSEDLKSINKRIIQINNAILRGHEIASHAVGHWSGGNWSTENWNKEFMSFNDIFFNFEKNNRQFDFKEKLNLKLEQIKGFRAPELSINNNMYKALSENRFKYDSSEINIEDKWPIKDNLGIWHIPISTIFLKKLNMSVIAVDYSIWMSQTNVLDILKKNTKEWKESFEDILNGYLTHFNENYNSNRAPMVIDNHFSKWNDGLYWEAMKSFALEICALPEVKCVSFSELVDYMEINRS